MNFFSKLIFVLTCVFIMPLYSWQTIDHVAELMDYIDSSQRTLVVFDIDNTLLHPQTPFGSDQWFSHLVRHHITRGLNYNDAVQKVVPLYSHINMHIDLIAIEPTISEDIAAIKSNCDRMVCLTARSHHLAERTVDQLHNNNLRFFEPSIEDHDIELTHPCLYRQGVLFCGLNNKGNVLLTFLNAIGYMPELIIFVDDKDHNLDAVHQALAITSINFIGLRYTGCDDHVAHFDMQVAEQELQQFLLDHPIKDVE